MVHNVWPTGYIWSMTGRYPAHKAQAKTTKSVI